MKELTDSTSETVQLARLDGLENVYLAISESPHPMKLVSAIGKRPSRCAVLSRYDDVRSALRDPVRFTNRTGWRVPDVMRAGLDGRFDDWANETLRFDTRKMISFGPGPHHCLGGALAQLEIRIVLEEIAAEVSEYEIDVAAAERVHSAHQRGLRAVDS